MNKNKIKMLEETITRFKVIIEDYNENYIGKYTKAKEANSLALEALQNQLAIEKGEKELVELLNKKGTS